MISAFGVSHGYISKSNNKRKENAKNAAIGAGAATTAAMASETATGKKVREYANRKIDQKALKVSEQLMPTGTVLQGKNKKDKAVVAGREIIRNNVGAGSDKWRRAAGIRDVGVRITEKGKNIGTLPYEGPKSKSPALVARRHITSHTKIKHAQFRPSSRGKGYGSDLMRQAVKNAPTSDVPRIKFMAANYGESKGPVGNSVWRRPGTTYIKGAAYGTSAVKIYTKKYWKNSGYDKKTIKEARRHVARSTVGLDKPSDYGKLSDSTREALSNRQWYGKVKGGKPFLGKTKLIGVGAAAGAGGYAAYKSRGKNGRKK